MGLVLVFINLWYIVGIDVIGAMSEFFRGMDFPHFYTASHLVLILKVPNHMSYDKFRPISLCSMIYKICSKILVTQLSLMLAKIICSEQCAFLLGWSIFENIRLTQEVIHGINKPDHGGNVALKIDMVKAYNCMDWGFLLHFLKLFGFSKFFCCLISQCINTPLVFCGNEWYSEGFL